jgi:hypothetical protein
LALKAMAEIREQLDLQLEIFKTLSSFKAVAEFQEEVLTTIGEVSREARQKIITRLMEKKMFRGDIKIY